MGCFTMLKKEKLMKIKTTSLYFLALQIIFQGQAHALPYDFDRFKHENLYSSQGKYNQSAVGLPGFIEKRFIGLSINEFQELVNENANNVYFAIFEDTLDDYIIKTIIFNGQYFGARGIYVFKNNIAVGYCILDNLTIIKDDLSNPIIYITNSLSQVSNLDFRTIPQINIKTFENSDSQFIERYTIMERPILYYDPSIITQNTNTRKELVLDSYYPKELDEYMKFEILNFINNRISEVKETL
jgi:hypothetical protein